VAESDTDIDTFLSLEQALHRPEVRRSREAVEELLANGFVEFGSSGRVYDRAFMIDALAQESSPVDSGLPKVRDFTVRALGPNAVLVTYRSVFGIGADERNVLRSSVWTLNGDNWQMLFHQGTVAAAGG
jgi:hypothetical protein